LFRLKDPRTNEIVDFEIQDLLPEEIVQEGTEIGAKELNGQIVNENSESESNCYSANYINQNYLSVTQLYKNNSGSTGTITLSETVNNFKYIEIIYGADGYKYSSKVQPGDGFATGVQSVFSSNDSIALYTSNWIISGTTITYVKASNKFIDSNNLISSFGTDPFVRIFEVLGYK
jgi:hypothetical protein